LRKRDDRRQSSIAADPFDPHDNILAGAAYIREFRDCYSAPGSSSPTMQTADVTKII
jgi:soluble lytic murein transglycosylase-like protein